MTFTLDSNKLGIYFSPTDVINEDIISSLNLDFNDLIGDHDVFSESYRTLKIHLINILKIYETNSFFEYISLIKNYDQNIFKQLKKVIPQSKDHTSVL
ncbi:MAG: hypothetical protein CM15mP10_2820 [Actinomycetota bacterium]|nr:MAG: hypothetical protein CM15mP10_2820 [Actinomycetota bacterium]